MVAKWSTPKKLIKGIIYQHESFQITWTNVWTMLAADGLAIWPPPPKMFDMTDASVVVGAAGLNDFVVMNVSNL